LVNNAGLNFVGDAELTTMDQYVNEVNINQLGLVRVTKAFLPEIRRIKGFILDVFTYNNCNFRKNFFTRVVVIGN